MASAVPLNLPPLSASRLDFWQPRRLHSEIRKMPHREGFWVTSLQLILSYQHLKQLLEWLVQLCGPARHHGHHLKSLECYSSAEEEEESRSPINTPHSEKKMKAAKRRALLHHCPLICAKQQINHFGKGNRTLSRCTNGHIESTFKKSSVSPKDGIGHPHLA